MDRLTKIQRSELMSSVRTAGTDIEKELSRCVRPLWRKERYRKNPKNILGKPDLLFSGSKLLIFADGDFWHGKDFEKWRKKISSFWRKKIASNIERDRKQNKILKKQGYKVLRFWGSYIKKNPEKVIEKIRENIKKKRYVTS